MITRSGPASGLAAMMRTLGERAPAAVEGAMREGGMMLGGDLVQQEIASTKPQPVDQGQYKAAWVTTPVEGGAVVGNTSKQALFIERGRGPGPVPLGPILAWVKRKGFVRASVKRAAKAQGRRSTQSDRDRAEYGAALAIQKKIQEQGIEPRWPLRRAIARLGPKMVGIIRRALGGIQL